MDDRLDRCINDIQELINKGRYFDAHNYAEKTIRDLPPNLRVQQLFGSILAKLGLTQKAQSQMESVQSAYPKDDETAGILGSIYKDLYKQTRDKAYAELSRNVYLENFRGFQSYYTGINAASMSLALGETKMAEMIALEVLQLIDPLTTEYWALATAGEAYLLLQRFEMARDRYEKAFDLAAHDIGKINSVHSQLLMLQKFIEIPESIFSQFRPPVMAVFTGHMIDRQDRSVPRFQNAMAPRLKEAIKTKIVDLDIRIGFSSLACGSDILFAECMAELGRELNIFLPFQMGDFIKASVAHAGSNWTDRFKALVDQFPVKYITEEGFLNDYNLFDFLGRILIGHSILRAQLLNTKPVMLCVLSESGAKKNNPATGGTSHMVEMWPFSKNLHVIDSDQFLGEAKPPIVSGTIPEEHMEATLQFEIERKIGYILFADIVGFTKMDEEQVPYFMHVLLGGVKELLQNEKFEPEIINTWGDSIFTVFKTGQALLEFAVAVSDAISHVDWGSLGFKSEPQIRIALHAGPIYIGMDPITSKKSAYGTHINRTARLEPVTQPGCIYASEQFAASLALESIDKYDIKHVGILKLPKGFGIQEVYQLSKKTKN